MGVAKFERFFRVAASLDIDKADLKRCQEFVDEKLYDLLLMGQATAKANHRDVLEPWDLPITKGLQERMGEFRKIDAEVELDPILQNVAARPPLDVVMSEEAEARLVHIAGAITVALALTFKIIDPAVKNPTSEHWDRAERIFDLLL
jgi:hypothetical protein